MPKPPGMSSRSALEASGELLSEDGVAEERRQEEQAERQGDGEEHGCAEDRGGAFGRVLVGSTHDVGALDVRQRRRQEEEALGPGDGDAVQPELARAADRACQPLVEPVVAHQHHVARVRLQPEPQRRPRQRGPDGRSPRAGDACEQDRALTT
jgi:hypothetical protein